MTEDTLVLFGLTALGIAIGAGTIGSFLTNRSTSQRFEGGMQAVLLGCALALIFSVSMPAGLLVIVLSLMILFRVRDGGQSMALFGALAQVSFALGLIGFVATAKEPVSLDSFISGPGAFDRVTDPVFAWATSLMVLYSLVAVTRNKGFDGQELSGQNGRIVLLLLSGFVAVSINFVGVLAVLALLIAPPLIARLFSGTETGALLLSIAVGSLIALASVQVAFPLHIAVGLIVAGLAVGLVALTSLSVAFFRQLE